MRILLFNRYLHTPAGTERMATLLANYLERSGHEVYVLVIQRFGPPFFKLNDNIKVLSLFENEKKDYINMVSQYTKCFTKYNKILGTVKPDLIIDLDISLSLLSLPLSKLHHCKVISWEHFNTFINWHTLTSKLARWLVSKLSYKIVLLTAKDKINFETKYHCKNVVCIQNPITLVSDSNVSLDSMTVLTIGRFSEQKGFSYLLDAWRLVVEKNKNWKLILVGDGELMDELIDQSEKAGLKDHVEFARPTTKIDHYYKKASIFVSSSLYEGLPLVLLEAKSFGLPIVSFDCETGPNIIVRDSIDGFLVPVADVSGLADKLLILIQDDKLRQKFGKSALADRQRFSPDEFYTQWDHLLEKA